MTHNGTCMNQKGKLHIVEWDYKNPEFPEDHLVTINGKCVTCDIEFQKTYSNPALSVISKTSRDVSNFNYQVDDLN